MKRYKKIYLEITNVCNLQCDFCPQTKRKAEFMSETAFTDILNQIKPFTDYIHLHVKGEPLLHPQLGKFLELSYEMGFKVNITTNGTLINHVADMLLEKPSVRQINFSLHSFDGNENNLSKAEYMDSILQFASKAIVDSSIIIAFRLWNLEEALLSADQRERNADITHRIEAHFQLPFPIQGNLSTSKAVKLADRIYLNHDYEFTWPDLANQEETAKGYCYGLKSQVAILVDGTVVPCCLDGEGVINLGNIHEQKFTDIINGKRAESIKLGFNNNTLVEELCRKCGFRTRFTKQPTQQIKKT